MANDYDYDDDQEGLLCSIFRISAKISYPFTIVNIVLSVILGALSTFALARKVKKNPDSNITFALFVASAAALFVACEVFISGIMLLEFHIIYYKFPMVAFLCLVAICQVCEIETIAVFTVLAIQRYVSWKKPIAFMNQSRKFIVAQFVGFLLLSHLIFLLTILPVLISDLDFSFWHTFYAIGEAVAKVFSLALTCVSIGLQLYVSSRRQWRGEANPDILSSTQAPVQFTSVIGTSATQKVSIVSSDEHHEPDNSRNDTNGEGKQSAVPRLMRIITIMTCLLCSLMCLDCFLLTAFYIADSDGLSCFHALLSNVSFYGFYLKFWILPAALIGGCESLRNELDFCSLIRSCISKMRPRKSFTDLESDQ